MTHHLLKANCQTVHLGGFSYQLKPVLTINPGDTIDVETYTGFYIYDKAPPEFLTPEFLEICQYLPSEQKVFRTTFANKTNLYQRCCTWRCHRS